MKKIVKLLSLVTTVVMMLSLFAVPAMAETAPVYHNSFGLARIRVPADTGIVETNMLGIKETFDGQPPAIGQTKYWGDATYKFSNYTNATVEDGVLKMAGTGGSRYYWDATTGFLNEGNDPHFNISAVSFSFMCPTLGNVEQLYRGMFSTTANIFATNGGPYINIWKYDTDGKYYLTYGVDINNRCMPIEAGRWYRLTIIMNKATKTFDMFVDGVMVRDDASFSNIGSSTQINGGLCSHRFYSAEGAVWYDDIMTYSIPEGKYVYFAEDFSGMVGRTADNARNPWYYSNSTDMSAFSNAVVAKDADGNAAITLTGTSEGQAVMRLGASPNVGYGSTVGRKGAVSFRFKTASTDTDANLFCQRIDGNSYGVDLWLSGTNLKTSLGGMNPITTLKTDIKADTWYSVIVDVDFTDINVASKTGGHWAVYLAEDGGEYECLAMDVPYNWHKTAATGNYAVYNMGRAFEAYVYYVDGKTSSVTYDDIMLYDDVREDILLVAGQSLTGEENALSTADREIAKPETQTGYALNWSADGTEIVENDTVTFGTAEAEKTYSITVVNEDTNANNQVTETRKFTITIPRMYVTNVSASNGVATGTVTVNANDVTDEGYADGLAILAVYDSTNKLVVAKPLDVTEGTANFSTDAITEAGDYTAKLFFMVDGKLKPLVNTDDISNATFKVVAAE